MKQVIISFDTMIWLVLAGLTGASWYLGEQQAAHMFSHIGVVSTGMLLIGFFKVRLVGLHFMELRQAPWLLRGAFELWVVLVACVILGLYWF